MDTVVKRDGSVQVRDIDKVLRWGDWALKGLNRSRWTWLVGRALEMSGSGCRTSTINRNIISLCISEKDPILFKLAARFMAADYHKEVFGGTKNIPTLSDFYDTMTQSEMWTDMDYSYEELRELESVIDHDKDLEYEYTTLKQIKQKYAISNVKSHEVFETPQFAYMRVALAVMNKMPRGRRLTDVKKLYAYLSDQWINPSTPFLNGPGTDFKGYASCCVFKGNDTGESIEAAEVIANRMTIMQAGIGGYFSIRSISDEVKGGRVQHQGKLPYYSVIDRMVKSNRQPSRGGSCTLHYVCVDPELLELIRAKSIRTVKEKRLDTMDYSIAVHPYLAELALTDEDWMLVSYKDAPELHEAIFSPDYDTFVNEYERVKADDSIPKTFIRSRTDFFILEENVRGENGRLYRINPYEMNVHTPFKQTIYSSNLCQEIFLPTEGFKDISELLKEDSDGEVALCFLAALCEGRIPRDQREEVSYYVLLMMDNIMEIMEYPFPTIAKSARARRSVGVGITNVANAMARAGKKYDDREGKTFLHQMFETHSYCLHRASLRLAKERGNCEWIDKTKYPEGWLPIDTYNRNVDKVCDSTLKEDWEGLRAEIIAQGGIRNSVLEATPPCESSSQASATTNSVLPIRSLFQGRKSGNVMNYSCAPDVLDPKIRDNYQFAYDISTFDLIDLYAIGTKFHGQGISADFYHDYSKNPTVSSKQRFEEFLYIIEMGLKSIYYLNFRTGLKDKEASVNNSVLDLSPEIEFVDEDDGCSGGVCKL